MSKFRNENQYTLLVVAGFNNKNVSMEGQIFEERMLIILKRW